VTGGDPEAFPPPIFAGTVFVCVFRVSLSPSLGNTNVGFIYAFLGQAEHQETEMDDIGGSRLKQA
jgi:hypothetical protein